MKILSVFVSFLEKILEKINFTYKTLFDNMIC